MTVCVTLLGLMFLPSVTESYDNWCPYPYELYPEGQVPLIACCRGPNCFCPRAKDFWWIQGGQCWALCTYNMKQCKPIQNPIKCEYPYKFFPDGSEPSGFCCRACSCKCARSQDNPLIGGGKCWAKCDCFGNCDAI